MASPDAVRLRHMQEAVTLALNMAGGRTRSDLTNNPMLAMALTRCLEVLGEAASKLSAEVRFQFPEIPCAKMISMRNRLNRRSGITNAKIQMETADGSSQ